MEDKGYEASAHLYDLFDQKENIEFFLHYAHRSGEILDIGAGTGRIAIPLAERGIQICCVEPSPSMRKEFERKLDHRKVLRRNIELIRGDARCFHTGRSFQAAFVSGSFDHLLDDEERIAPLSNINRHLTIGGLLIFDVYVGLMKDSSLAPAGEVQLGRRTYRRQVAMKILPEEILEVCSIYEILERGELVERIEQISHEGMLRRERLHALLDITGFRVQKEFGDFDCRPFQQGDPLLIIEAVKRSDVS